MRPGETSTMFVGGRHDHADQADRIDVTCTVSGDDSVTFNLKAAYLP